MKIEGRNPVIELLRSNREISKILMEDGINIDEKVAEILMRATNRKIKIDRVGKKKLDKLSTSRTHQGVIALAEITFPKLSSIIEINNIHHLPNNFIYIREALYEHNIGAIARSAEAAGFKSIIIPPKVDISAQTFRVSMGALANLKIIKESLFTAIKSCKEAGIKVVGIEVTTDKYYYDENLTGDTLLIIGGEDHPLSTPVLDQCDTVVKIPMHGKINSLNMSVACSVVLFEKLRQEVVLKAKTQ